MLADAVERAFTEANTVSQIEGAYPVDDDSTLSSFTLRVTETPGQEIGFNIARVEPDMLDMLYAEPGEVVEISGPKKSTAALVRPTHEEVGPKVAIRLDRLLRRNAGVSVGDKVSVRRIECADAEHISVAIVSSEARQIDLSPCVEDYIAGALAVTRKPLKQGDIFVVPGVSHRGNYIPMVVLSTVPDGFVQAHQDTTLSLQSETVPESKLADRQK
jgi:transitional endoplasmic reticulum ATPase